MKQGLLCGLFCLFSFAGMLFADANVSEQPVAQPASADLFKNCTQQENSSFNFLVAPIAPPAGQPATTPVPLSNDGSLTDDPVHTLQNILNNNIIKQIGVGVQFHF